IRRGSSSAPTTSRRLPAHHPRGMGRIRPGAGGVAAASEGAVMAEAARSSSELEIVPRALRRRLGWDERHDQAAATIIKEYGLTLPRDCELVRQLAFARVAQGPVPWLERSRTPGGQ